MVTPEHAVDVINERFGRHPGTRALHAKGTVCRGTFTPLPAGAELTRATLFRDGPLEATVRISNGGGNPDDPDWRPDVRGLAVKVYGPDGNWDVSSQSSPQFPAATTEAFLDLLVATSPSPSALWKLPAFLARNPRVALKLPGNASALKPPASYATTRFYAIHAFRWVAPDGTVRFVRYRWRPEAGEQKLGLREARSRGQHSLRYDLLERLERSVALR